MPTDDVMRCARDTVQRGLNDAMLLLSADGGEAADLRVFKFFMGDNAYTLVPLPPSEAS